MTRNVNKQNYFLVSHTVNGCYAYSEANEHAKRMNKKT